MCDQRRWSGIQQLLRPRSTNSVNGEATAIPGMWPALGDAAPICSSM
jgi:hypothetical protein